MRTEAPSILPTKYNAIVFNKKKRRRINQQELLEVIYDYADQNK